MKYILFLASLAMFVTASGQMRSYDMKRRMFGTEWNDPFFDVMKQQGVQTIKKVMNSGEHVMTMRIDKKGRVIYFQQDKGYTADSFDYDDQDRETHKFSILKGEVLSYIFYDYRGDTSALALPVVYNCNKEVKVKQQWYDPPSKQSPTVLVSHHRNGEKEIATSSKVAGVDYSEFVEYDSTGKATHYSKYYTIPDNRYEKKYKRGRPLERGEMNMVKDLTESIAGEYMRLTAALGRGEKIDTAKFIDIYTLAAKNDMDAEALAIISRRYPHWLEKGGVRVVQHIYEYDDAHGGRIKSHCLDGHKEHCELYFYDEAGRLSEKRDVFLHPYSTRYFYKPDGLLDYIQPEDRNQTKEQFEYSFY